MESYLTSITNYLWSQSWQIAVLAVIITMVSILLKNKSAHIRYLLWLILLVKCLVPPLLSVPLAILPREQIAQPIIESAIEISPVTINTAETTIDEPVVSLPASLAEPTIFDKLSTVTLSQWLVFAWILGVAIFTLVAVIKALRVNRWLRQEREPLVAELQAGIENLFSNLRVQTFPKVWLVEGIGQPFVWGLLRGGIYLPSDFAEIKAEEHRRGILGHELSHVLRFDAAVNLLQIIAQTVFWFHPLVWWANKKIRAEREKCCDEMAIAWLGTKARDFSTAIVNILTAEHKSTQPIPSLAVAGPVKNIEDRIKTIMNPSKKFYKHPSILAAITTLLLGLIIVPTTLALTSKPANKPDVQVEAPSESADINDTDSIDPNAVKEDLKIIARQVLQYKLVNKYYPENLQQLNQALPKDIYGLSGEDYHYESDRKRFIISSCGEDHIYGNDDDQIYYVDFDRRKKRYGQRYEIYPLEEIEDTYSQTEMAGPSGVRPKGNCSLRGKVVCAETGEPVDHARVYLFYLGTHAPIFINVASDGSFVFKDIPTGPFSLRTTRTAGYQDAVYNPESKLPGQYPQFSLAEGEQRSDVILEVEPAFRISGKVLDENGKIPENIDALTVLAWIEKDGGQGYESEQARVNREDGSYLIDGLSSKPVYVMAINWGAAKEGNVYPPIYYPSTFSRNEAELITFDDQWDVKNIDIQLQKTGGLILEGTVSDESGQPVPEAFVVVHRRDMFFDFVTAYTDEQGNYQIQGLGDGEFLIHVDAVHRGLVRTRTPINIESANQKTQLDFTLKRGVTISGKFVDIEGNDWQIGRSYGHAIVKEQSELNSDSGTITKTSFSLTNFRNKYRPKDVRDGSGGEFYSGEGDYEGGSMIFPTKSTFILQGMMPGQTLITFSPKKESQEVLEILYNGQNIMETGIETQPGQDINDVTIVVGTP
ncbi:MAG: M56 family metallopeptidase [Planctomycetota bacterium]